MIALDANTALMPFRDSEYDLKELAIGLAALVSSDLTIHQFRYADGSVQPMVTATLLRSIVEYFPHAIIDGTVVLTVTDDGLLIGRVRGIAGLQARIEGRLLEYVGGGDAVPIVGGIINKLTVRGLTTIKDASQALEGQTVVNATTQVVHSLNKATISSATVSGKAALHEAKVTHVAIGSLYCSQVGATTSSINKLNGRSAGYEKYLAWYDKLGANAAVADCIVLESNTMEIAFAGTVRTGQVRQAKYTCCIPYTEDGEIRYIAADSITVSLTDNPMTVSAPNGMTDFLIWPSWATYSVGTVSYYNTYWHARILGGVGSFPVVTVRNDSDAPIRDVANVWSFGKQIRDGREMGSVSVLNRITIPPHSAVEFLFSYDGSLNIAYMSPARAL